MEIFTALMFGYCAYIVPREPFSNDRVALGRVHHYAAGAVCEPEWFIGDKAVYLIGDHVITLQWRGDGLDAGEDKEDRRDVVLFIDDTRYEINHHTGA
jgi:hypothetical protein